MRSTNNLKIINEVLIYYRRHENITSQGNFNSYQTIPLKKLILRIFDKRHVLRERKSLGKKYSYFLWAKLIKKILKTQHIKLEIVIVFKVRKLHYI